MFPSHEVNVMGCEEGVFLVKI